MQAAVVLRNLITHYGPQHWWEDGQWVRAWVTMILVQQATAQNVARALANLDTSTLAALRALPEAELADRIRPAGFYRQKAKSIQALLAWWAAHGDTPQAAANVPTPALRQSLLAVRGIGQETADVMLLYLFRRRVFVADQYALRLFNRLGFGPYRDYAALRAAMMPLAEQTPYATVREWHGVIDEHGKQFRHNADLDEAWLLQEDDRG